MSNKRKICGKCAGCINRNKYKQLNEQFNAIKKLYTGKQRENFLAQKQILKQSANAAVQCAIEIQKEYRSMDLTGAYYNGFTKKNSQKQNKRKQKKKEKIEFRVKTGVGMGKIHLLIVGGLLNNHKLSD